MSADTSMPKGITRGYSNSVKDMLSTAAAKVLSIKDLEALDEADCYREIARSELQNRVKSEDEAA